MSKQTKNVIIAASILVVALGIGGCKSDTTNKTEVAPAQTGQLPAEAQDKLKSMSPEMRAKMQQQVDETMKKQAGTTSPPAAGQ